MPTNEQVWLHGDEGDSWPCDLNPETGELESNAGREWSFTYEGREYRVITDTTETVLYRAKDDAIPVARRNADDEATRAG